MGHTNQAPHRTTQASSFTAPSSNAPQTARAFTRKEKVPTAIVIGGGPSGLISARRLAAAGMRVTLLEQKHHLGGAVGAHEVGGLLLDSGAESFATPHHFGTNKSQAVIGVQMASAYIGTCSLPPLFGFIANRFGISLLPVYVLFFCVLMIASHERLIRLTERRPESIV